MNILPDRFYHLYNRTNRDCLAFSSPDNYGYFQKKVEKEWKAYFEILCYCLMPTHFHFILYAPPEVQLKKANYAIGKLLSSYTRAINLIEGTHGSLFQNHSKCKDLQDDSKIFDNYYTSSSYLKSCFCYIHRNPRAAGIVKTLDEWNYSSYHNFANCIPSTICNMELAEKVIGFKRGEEFIKLIESDSEERYEYK